ncbi:MAG: isochorismatase family protein [Burkholderiaceae bacterium]
MAHQRLHPAFDDLIEPDAPVEQLATGFEFTEGPIWHPRGQYLLFSDMPGDVRRRWDSAAGVREQLRGSNKGNGLTYDAQLNLVVCEHATSSVARFDAQGRRQVLASHFDGRELNSPNDVCVHSDGSIYFSDPSYGRMPYYGIERRPEQGFQGVYRIAPGQVAGEPQLLVDRFLFKQPNGLCFSPDERLLYVNDTDQANIRVFDVQADGGLSGPRLFASGVRDSGLPGVPDGMKCDSLGNVWVTAPGGLWVFDPGGRVIGKIRIPEPAANLHWGGPDWRTLFVCATRSVYTVRTRIGPRIEPFMRGHPAAAGDPPPASALPVSAPAGPAGAAIGPLLSTDPLHLQAADCALLIQDMQNDVVIAGGAFADSGSPAHCTKKNTIANIARLAAHCRRHRVPVIHVWFIVGPGALEIPMNAPLFLGLREANALVRDTWGAQPAPGLEPQPGDHVVIKNRMSAWEGSSLETTLKALGSKTIIDTGAWTNMSIEHTARTGADKGYRVILPEDACSTMNDEWHLASVNYAMQNVATVVQVDTVIAALH